MLIYACATPPNPMFINQSNPMKIYVFIMQLLDASKIIMFFIYVFLTTAYQRSLLDEMIML